MILIIWPSVKEKKRISKKVQIYILYKQYATQQLIEIHQIDLRKLIGHYFFVLCMCNQ